MNVSTTISAGGLLKFAEEGDFFRYLEGTAAITVTFYRNGAEVSKAEGVKPGFAEDFQTGSFNEVAIQSATAQAIQFVTRLGNVVNYDAPPTGSVVLQNAGAFTQAAATVTNASAQLVAANAARKYLLVQNKDTSGDIYLNLAGAAATVANGIKVGPGDSLELAEYLPTGAIFAIGSIASNANIVVAEG